MFLVRIIDTCRNVVDTVEDTSTHVEYHGPQDRVGPFVDMESALASLESWVLYHENKAESSDALDIVRSANVLEFVDYWGAHTMVFQIVRVSVVPMAFPE
jgi:hypothetical protein